MTGVSTALSPNRPHQLTRQCRLWNTVGLHSILLDAFHLRLIEGAVSLTLPCINPYPDQDTNLPLVEAPPLQSQIHSPLIPWVSHNATLVWKRDLVRTSHQVFPGRIKLGSWRSNVFRLVWEMRANQFPILIIYKAGSKSYLFRRRRQFFLYSFFMTKVGTQSIIRKFYQCSTSSTSTITHRTL